MGYQIQLHILQSSESNLLGQTSCSALFPSHYWIWILPLAFEPNGYFWTKWNLGSFEFLLLHLLPWGTFLEPGALQSSTGTNASSIREVKLPTGTLMLRSRRRECDSFPTLLPGNDVSNVMPVPASPRAFTNCGAQSATFRPLVNFFKHGMMPFFLPFNGNLPLKPKALAISKVIKSPHSFQTLLNATRRVRKWFIFALTHDWQYGFL